MEIAKRMGISLARLYKMLEGHPKTGGAILAICEARMGNAYDAYMEAQIIDGQVHAYIRTLETQQS